VGVSLLIIFSELDGMNIIGICHTHMHGLIHDGQLQACQSCLLGLMDIFRLLYAIRCFRVMVCLRFQLVAAI